MVEPITTSSLAIVTILALLKAIKKISSRLESSSCTTKDIKIEVKANTEHISDSSTDEPDDSPPPHKKRSKSR